MIVIFFLTLGAPASDAGAATTRTAGAITVGAHVPDCGVVGGKTGTGGSAACRGSIVVPSEARVCRDERDVSCDRSSGLASFGTATLEQRYF